jgi:hypothetical protein
VPRPADPQVAAAEVDKLLGMTRIFMAPLVVSSPVLAAVERELIHHLQCGTPECRSFLANGPADPSGLSLRLTSVSPNRLIWLEPLAL